MNAAPIINSPDMEDVPDRAPSPGSNSILSYLLEREPEFGRLHAIRKEGWNSPQGDAFFANQRRAADHADSKTKHYFYQLMKAIGEDLQSSLGAFTVGQTQERQPRILDTCMAPGGFLAVALRHNRRASALCFTLPVDMGGHEILLDRNEKKHLDLRQVDIKPVDVTMLAADIGMDQIPVDHPEADKFLPRQVEPGDMFDIAICDGQVLRTHERLPYRETSEARRLTAAQLVLAMRNLRPGGTLIMLLHKVESPRIVLLLYSLHKFAELQLFKSRQGHTKRSSFYLVAKNVQSRSEEAQYAIETWRQIWEYSTFETSDERWREFGSRSPGMDVVLEQFGETLIELGRDIWRIQAEALERAPFNRRTRGRARGQEVNRL